MQVMMWSTADGTGRGRIRSDCELLCCDISHNDLCEILVTLEIDGEIRLFKNLLVGDRRVETFRNSWELATNISLSVPVVEVKVERSLLLAVSHSENGEQGAIHVWEILSQHFADEFEILLTERRSLQCAFPPDRVEARHGGRFIEAFFIPTGSGPQSRPPDGIYDIEWFDVTMKSLLKLRGIGDWRCDLRDTVARLEDDMSVSWLPLWHPVFRTCSK